MAFRATYSTIVMSKINYRVLGCKAVEYTTEYQGPLVSNLGEAQAR